MLFYHTYKYGEIELTFIVNLSNLVINSFRLIILIIYSFGFCAVISSVSDGFYLIIANSSHLHLVFVLFQWLGHHRSWHPHLSLDLGDIFKTGYHELLSYLGFLLLGRDTMTMPTLIKENI